MKWQYRLYGRKVVATRPIPGVPTSTFCGAADIRVWFGKRPPLANAAGQGEQFCFESCAQDDNDTAECRLWHEIGGRYYRLVFSDEVEFIIDRQGRQIGVTWPSASTPEDAASYLLGPILAVALTLQHVICLHASAVAIAGEAVALVGPSGAGKSTTAATFARLGYAVLSDDLLPLQDTAHGFVVQPGYPGLRLWSDSATALFGSAEALPLLTPTWDKRYLDLFAFKYPFQHDELPLAAIYFLDDRQSSSEAPVIQSLSPATGLLALLANCYVTHEFDRQQRQREFELLSRVARQVPLRRVQPLDDPKHLASLCEAISRDAQACRHHHSDDFSLANLSCTASLTMAT